MWRNKYYDLQSYRIYERKQAGYKRTQMDELLTKSFLKDQSYTGRGMDCVQKTPLVSPHHHAEYKCDGACIDVKVYASTLGRDIMISQEWSSGYLMEKLLPPVQLIKTSKTKCNAV